VTRDIRRQMFAAVRDRPDEWYRIGAVHAEVVGEQDGGGSRSTADVYIYDRIGGWSGVSADDFVRDVVGLDVDHIDLHLNSPGGDAMEGVAIANVLRQHRADVTVWVDGLAASAASVVAMAGDEVVMGIGSQLMIHDAWALCIGDAAEMRKAAEMLDSTSSAYASAYAAKAGGTTADWRAVMVEETWYTGEEAVAAGLADRLATESDNGRNSGEQVVPGGGNDFWDMWDSFGSADRHADAVRALYAHAGRADAPPPRMPNRPATQTPAASAGGFTSPQEDDTMSTLTEGLRQRLGFAEDADEATILASVEQLKARADAPKLPEGAVAIEKEQLEQLQAAAREGQEAREQQRAEGRERLVAAAISDGRVGLQRVEPVLPPRRGDPEGAEASLKALAPGLIPVGERGHDQAGADVSDSFNQAEYDAMASALGIQKGV
jgi:ATP-dependent protease ClpP protease subunit